MGQGLGVHASSVLSIVGWCQLVVWALFGGGSPQTRYVVMT